MSFFEAIAVCLSKYATFTGRASRAEFWWFVLFNSLTALIINALFAPFLGAGTGLWLATLFLVVMLLPSLAVGARRLHDMNVSGWWQLLHLSGIGSLFLYIWMMFAGSLGANRYGEPVVAPEEL
jgi:uncharacterized membrane protein YhaH (DUF805 family)